MDQETPAAGDTEVLVNLAVYDYHAALDRGEEPDAAEWAARYPQVASEIVAYFEDLKALPRLRPPASTVPLGTTAPPGRPVVEGPTLAELRPGDVLGDFVLLEKLDEGGQGVVWKASPRHAREIVVALKTLLGPATNDPASIYRLREDAHAIARMRHPHIIGISYFGEDRGRWYFVMELMRGGTVAGRLASYKADLRSTALLVEKIARAVHHAHTRNPGVLHLDLKPGNILLTADGEPKVTDFGLSVRCETIGHPGPGGGQRLSGDRNFPDDAAATIARVGIVGTIAFMSPEMADGRWPDVSTGSDVYGLGAILYAMLAGGAPFPAFAPGETIAQALARVAGGGVTSPRELNRRVDPELNAVCLRCLRQDPKERYGSADALANDLRRWLDRRPTLAGGRPSAAREARFWTRRHPLRLALVGVAAIALWVAGLAISVVELRAENAREAARLAGQVDRELRLIRRATQILAGDPRLRSAFASPPAPGQAGRRGAIEAFLRAAVEGENLFGIAGGNPLVNAFVLDPDGVLLADTLEGSPSVGRSYRVRDYFRALSEGGWPPDHVYVARSFLSTKDARYKIAVSTRIWGDGGEALGLLVANFTIGPRLIDLDMTQEPDATVLCPMDQSDPGQGRHDRQPPWPYIPVLDRRYLGQPGDRPIEEFDPSRLPDFQGNPKLIHADEGPWGGRLVDHHRVGETHMIARLTRRCSWPLSWLPDFR